MKKIFKASVVRTITLLMIVSIPFLGSSCEDVLNQIIQPPTGDITGDWQLIYNAGTTNDICPGEMVNFPNASGGSATLQCPGGTAINRDYTINGSTLTYTGSGATYEIAFTQNNELVLDGSASNGRVLYYSNQITGQVTDKPANDKQTKSALHNSSEIK